MEIILFILKVVVVAIIAMFVLNFYIKRYEKKLRIVRLNKKLENGFWFCTWIEHDVEYCGEVRVPDSFSNGDFVLVTKDKFGKERWEMSMVEDKKILNYYKSRYPNIRIA